MLTPSLLFFAFMTSVSIAYLKIPQKWQNSWLVFSSVVFAVIFLPLAIPLIFMLIAINYFFGVKLDNTKAKQKKYWLYACIALNISLLILYFIFRDTLIEIVSKVSFYQINVNTFILPVGATFIILQSISYIIERYKSNNSFDKRLGSLILFLLFFPKLTAGPIENPNNLIPQFYVKHNFDKNRIFEGIRLVLWGLFQKIIADRLLVITDKVFLNLNSHFGIELIITAIFTAVILYCNFCAYNDISCGFARIMGFNLSHNFNLPFLASNPSTFWERYNIKITSWVEEYITKYFPKKIQKSFKYFISGFILKLDFNSIIYGLVAAIPFVKIGENKKLAKKAIQSESLILYFLKWLAMIFSALFTAVLLRSENLHQVVEFINNIRFKLGNITDMSKIAFDLGVSNSQLALSILATITIIILGFGRFENEKEYPSGIINFYKNSKMKRYIIYNIIIIMTLVFSTFNSSPFIFNF